LPAISAEAISFSCIISGYSISSEFAMLSILLGWTDVIGGQFWAKLPGQAFLPQKEMALSLLISLGGFSDCISGFLLVFPTKFPPVQSGTWRACVMPASGRQNPAVMLIVAVHIVSRRPVCNSVLLLSRILVSLLSSNIYGGFACRKGERIGAAVLKSGRSFPSFAESRVLTAARATDGVFQNL
jgi:hypothetical protein